VAENQAAWKALEAFEKPFVTAFSDGDAVTRGGEAAFQARVPGAKGQPHVTLSGGHFLQEDSPEEIAALIEALIVRRAKGFA
jgi:haloalkane dehalogenase